MKDYYQLIPGDDKYYTLIPGNGEHYRLTPGSSSDIDLMPTDATHSILVSAHTQSCSRFGTLKSLLQRTFSQKGDQLAYKYAALLVRITEFSRKIQEVMNLWIT